MNAGKAVYGILSANSGVTDIVGTNIFPEIAEQEAVTPFVIYQLQSVAPEDTHDGPSKLDEVRFEFLCYADSYNAAADLGVAVRAALDRVSGTYNGVHVESVQFNDVDVEIEYDPRRYSQVLKFTFRIKRDDVTIALGTPVTGAVLGDLSDVDVTGVTNGQLIAYNSTSGNWEAANDAGGAEQLNDLSDVIVNLPASGEVLKYDGGEFVNDNLTKADVGLGNVDNTSDADKPVSTATQTALNAKADTSAVPTTLNDLSDVTIAGTPTGNEALIYDGTANVFKSLPNFTNRFEDEAEVNKQGITPFAERVYTVKADGDGIFIDPESDTPTAGKVIVRKIYQKAGFLESGAVIGDFTLIHTFADDTAYSATNSTFEGFRDGDTYGTPPFTLIQTWEEQTAAPAFTGLLNESYGSGAAAAYSVRRLNGNYTGSAIQVERSSDNTTQDIGFDSNGDLDESALTTFCTGTTCRVRSWYDQSQTGGTGSGNDAVQTTHANQPTIYTGGAIVKENGRVAVDFDGADDVLTLSSVTYGTGFIIYKNDAITGLLNTVLGGSGSQHTVAGTLDNFISDGTNTTTGNTEDVIFTHLSTGITGSTSYIYSDGIQEGTGSTSNFAITKIGVRSDLEGDNRFYMDGKVQEAIIYASDKSTDRTSIESNVGDYFTQNTPLLDTYTGAAAAYSLRKLRSAYSGSAIRVRRASDNAEQDIGFNVFGELDTVSLASFCSGTDGFVKTWYSQVGTGVDATQTATGSQPKIYDSATGVVTENGKPAVEFDGSNDYLESANVISGTTARSILSVNNDTGGSDSSIYTATKTNTGLGTRYLFGTNNNGTNIQVVVRGGSAGGSYTGNTQHVVSHFLAASSDINTLSMFVDNSALTLTTSSEPVNTHNDNAWIGAFEGPSQYWTGTQQELIIYTSDQSANRTNIEDNINTFYSIY